MEKQEQVAPASDVTERLKTVQWAPALPYGRIVDLAARYWEAGLYALIVVFGAVIRFYDLGSRALHHDESLHSRYAWEIATGIGYDHVPFMHGMFQFMGNGAVMWLLGDSDYTARVLAATMGSGMIVLPLLLRGYLGRLGALSAATLIAISPTLFYYSRFTREDIYTGFWTLALVVCIWRYLASQHEGWLYGAAGALAFSFATKETTFMTALIFMVFLNYMAAADLGRQIVERRKITDPATRLAVHVALFPFAWLLAILWPFVAPWRRQYGLELPVAAPILIVLGTLTAPQFTAGATQKVLGDALGIGWFESAGFGSARDHVADGEQTMAQYSTLFLIFVTAYFGMLWDARKWLISGVIFYFVFTFLFTTSFTNPAGFWSGIWGSLDYWLQEQHTRRGDQPEFYYFILLPVYEFLPLAIALVGTLYYAFRGELRDRLIAGSALVAIVAIAAVGGNFSESTRNAAGYGVVLLAILLLQVDTFLRFLLVWFFGMLMAVSLAGEKMPWLNVHLALPLAILAARYVNDFYEGTNVKLDLPPLERWAPYVYVAIGAGLGTVVFLAVGPATWASVGGWLLLVVAVGAAAWAYYSFAPRVAAQVLVTGVVTAMAVFAIKVGWTAAITHGDEPRDMLIYTQTTHDLREIRDEIDRLAVESGKGRDLVVQVDASEGFAWPWSWYLRNYRYVGYPSMGPDYQPEQDAVLLVAKTNASYIDPGKWNLSQGIPYRHRAWFPEEYKGYTFSAFANDILRPAQWKEWSEFFFQRKLPASTGSSDAVAFFPAGFESGLSGDQWVLPDEPTVTTEGNQTVFGGTGSKAGQYVQPAGVAVSADGTIYVVDSGNQRVQMLDAEGNAVGYVGGPGSGPGMFGQATDGPWGIAVGPDGSVYVADTWNHRIQKFGSDLTFVTTWGRAYTGEAMELDTLFGPRSIAIDAEGNLLVADTGNARIIKFSPDGKPLGSFGTKFPLSATEGAQPGDGDPALEELWEPAGIAIGPQSDVYVADFWNLRIVHLSADLTPIDAIDVPTWGSRYVTDRPYLLALDDGRLLATDPGNGTILVFGADGALESTYEVPDTRDAPARPIALAQDPDGDVLVSDGAGNVVRKIPLSDIAP